MLVRHKVAKKEDGGAILKKYRLKPKDEAALAKLPQNKDLFKKIKSLDNIKPGDVIWVPDPSAKCYIVPYMGKKIVLTEAEWKDLQKKSKAALGEAVKKAQSTFDQFEDLYKAQEKVNDDFPIVSFLSSNWIGDKGDKPVSQYKKAAGAVSSLKSAVAGGDYKKIQDALRQCEKDVSAFGKGVKEWREQLIGSAENWQTGLEIYRDGSYVFLGALAMTAAAPASIGAGVMVGAGIGGASGFTKSAINELGRSYAGAPVTVSSATVTIAVDTLKGAGFGALGAGAAGAIGKLAAPFMARIFANGGFVTGLVSRTLSKSPVANAIMKRVTDKATKKTTEVLVRNLGRELSPTGHKLVATVVREQLPDIARDTVAKFIIRLGPSGTIATLRNVMEAPEVIKESEKHLKTMFQKPRKKQTENDMAEELAERLKSTKATRLALDALLKDHAKEIEFEIQREVTLRVLGDPRIRKETAEAAR